MRADDWFEKQKDKMENDSRQWLITFFGCGTLSAVIVIVTIAAAVVMVTRLLR